VQRLGQPDVLDGGTPGRAEPGERLANGPRREELSASRTPSLRSIERFAEALCLMVRSLALAHRSG
jgi:hypothetical protein